ncbi:MAG: DUF6356 family protein [Alphaproteobacteria bacterium]
MIDRLFLAHPRSVDETYFEHLQVAASFGWRLARAAGACLVHALVPGLFVTTASAAVGELHDEMVVHRRRSARLDARAQPS